MAAHNSKNLTLLLPKTVFHQLKNEKNYQKLSKDIQVFDDGNDMATVTIKPYNINIPKTEMVGIREEIISMSDSLRTSKGKKEQSRPKPNDGLLFESTTWTKIKTGLSSQEKQLVNVDQSYKDRPLVHIKLVGRSKEDIKFIREKILVLSETNILSEQSEMKTQPPGNVYGNMKGARAIAISPIQSKKPMSGPTLHEERYSLAKGGVRGKQPTQSRASTQSTPITTGTTLGVLKVKANFDWNKFTNFIGKKKLEDKYNVELRHDGYSNVKITAGFLPKEIRIREAEETIRRMYFEFLSPAK